MRLVPLILLGLIGGAGGFLGVTDALEQFGPYASSTASTQDTSRSSTQDTSKPSTGTSTPWKQQTLVELSFASPFELKPKSVPTSSAGGAIRSVEFHQHTTKTSSAGVMRMLYQEGVQVSLQGAVDGAIRNATNYPGVQNLQHIVQPSLVAGRSAARVSASFDQPRGKGRMESLVIVDGTTAWMVQMVFDESLPDAQAQAERLLSSLEVLSNV